MHHSLNYSTQGSGTPFVFQHGLGAELNQSLGLMGGLSGVQLLAMDCPGHGKSPFNKQKQPSFNQYTDDLNSILEKEGVNQAVFGGISMGSAISVQMALRFPEKVKALVLVRPAWLDKGYPENLKILLEVADFIEQGKGEKDFEKTTSFQEMNKDLPLAAASVMGLFSKDQLEVTPTVLRNMVADAPFSNLEELRGIEVPVLIIVNQHDPLHPLEFGEIYHQYLPNSHLVEVTSRYKDNDKHTNEVRKAAMSILDSFV